MDVSDTLQTLDRLLEPFPVRDTSTELLSVEESRRSGVESQLTFKHVMEMASVDTLRMHHIKEVLAAYRTGCAEYLYCLIRVHAGFELSYHPCLLAATGVREQDWHNPDAIREFWIDWWVRHTENAALSGLNWRPSSPRLGDAVDALLGRYEEAARFLEHDSEIVRQSLARRSDLDLHAQFDLVDDPSPVVRLELARNKNTDAAILDELANDLNSVVRRWVGAHPHVREETLSRLASDPVEGVRKFMERRRA